MKLRTQLIVAFFLLAVVPLTGLTLYSYTSSIRAFRHAVEEQSALATRQMKDQMERVRNDLGRRFQHLADLPFDQLLAEDPGKLGPDAERLYSIVLDRMGDDASLLESVELWPQAPSGRAAAKPGRTPPPPPPPPPSAGRPFRGRGPNPDSVMIYLPEGLPTSPPADGPPPPAASAGESRNDFISIARREGNRIVLRQLLRRSRFQAVKTTRLGQELKSLEREAAQIGRQADPVEELISITGAELEEKKRSAQAVVRASKESIRSLISWDFNPIVRGGSGRAVRAFKAHFHPSRVLRRALERTRLQPDDIPFAVNSEGQFFTPDPADSEKLQGIHMMSWINARSPDSQPPEDWVVVTSKESGSGLTFGIARPIGDSLYEIRQTAIWNLVLGFSMASLAVLGILPISRRMTRNLRGLTRGAERLAGGNLKTRVPVRSKDEFGQLSRAFNRMAVELEEHERRLVQQERLRKELEMCRHIQEELLPRTPLHLPFAQVKGISIPAREVGGDFFNYFVLADGDVAILIGDVSGKGVPAALLMANLQATLQARLGLERDLAKLARELDREIAEQTPSPTYLTLFMGILSAKEKKLRWVNAGHNTQFALRTGQSPHRLESSGRPLGLLPGGGYEERTLQLADGDCLFLYTDGLVDTENPEEKEFGVERLESILITEQPAQIDNLLTRVEEVVNRYRRGAEVGDDATLMVLRIGDPA
ncbi:MAG: PP2C family protein-serine/threonine phosphatase [Acidobacteriota bacterium]